MKLQLTGNKELLLTGLGEASWCPPPSNQTKGSTVQNLGCLLPLGIMYYCRREGKMESIVVMEKDILLLSCVVVSPDGSVEFSHRLLFGHSLPLFPRLIYMQKTLTTQCLLICVPFFTKNYI